MENYMIVRWHTNGVTLSILERYEAATQCSWRRNSGRSRFHGIRDVRTSKRTL